MRVDERVRVDEGETNFVLDRLVTFLDFFLQTFDVLFQSSNGVLQLRFFAAQRRQIRVFLLDRFFQIFDLRENFFSDVCQSDFLVTLR